MRFVGERGPELKRKRIGAEERMERRQAARRRSSPQQGVASLGRPSFFREEPPLATADSEDLTTR
jgi:hypothetical protein